MGMSSKFLYMKVLDYQIVVASTLENLSKLVINEIKCRWIPIGNFVVITDRIGNEEYAQTMVTYG